MSTKPDLQPVTRKYMRECGACYTDDEIAAVVPARGLTALETARLSIPDKDRVWALTRPGVLEISVLWEWTAHIVELLTEGKGAGR
jgi:hypothetical protein